MKRLCGIVFLALLPAFALAVDTPTPTRTPSRNSPEDAIRALFIPLVTTLATAVPTAYSTPQVINSKPVRIIGGRSTLDCEAVLSLDGGGADNYIVPPAATAFSPEINIPLKEAGLYHDKNINIRGNGACSAGKISIWGGF